MTTRTLHFIAPLPLTAASVLPGRNRVGAGSSVPAFPLPVARAFSLVEVLLGIFILGIGVISVAALFPAGIVQQRQSLDQVTGPIVANNALSVIRLKVQPEDFGTMEDFGDSAVNRPYPTALGDWSWVRPSLILEDDPNTPLPFNETGAIDIFSFTTAGTPSVVNEFQNGLPSTTPSLRGVPYNIRRYAPPSRPPHILITQQERAYPQLTQYGDPDIAQPTPQYYWDCMFRRSGGRIQVAIFVYRVTYPGGAPVPFNVADITYDPGLNVAAEPRIPFFLPFIAPQNYNGGVTNTSVNFGGPWDAGGLDANRFTLDDNALVYGNENPGYDPLFPTQAWQEPGQWLVDQNAYVHRVLSFSDGANFPDGHARVELVRPVPEVPTIPTNFIFDAGNNPANLFNFDNTVSGIWYIPIEVDTNADGRTDLKLTPVYATVKDL